jgi:opacity protein-like surface antigen
LSFAIVALMTVRPAAAQERGFVQGMAGLTFGTETSTVFGGGFGVNVAPSFQITGELGYMRNILPKFIQDDANEAARGIEELILLIFRERVDVRVDAKAPAFYGMAGGRFIAPTGRVRPFVGASAGFAHVSPEVRLELDDEDVTEDAIDEGFLDRPESVSKFLMTAGGGVTINAGRAVAIDIGYTWMRIFATQGINVNRAYAAVGYRF